MRILFTLVALLLVFFVVQPVQAQDSPEFSLSGINQLSEIGQQYWILDQQNPGGVILNPLKHLIRRAIEYGVPIDTIILLLLLPLVAAVISGARHLIGLRGFGIFMPAALSIAFVATGPVLGIGLFLFITVVTTVTRLALRKLKLKLQYLPRMALILWVVVLSVMFALFSGPLITTRPEIADISIFPVLVLILLVEDFTRAQLGKSIRVAISLTTETLILALVSFAVLELRFVQEFALLNPEILLLGVLLFDFFLGKYAGLRFMEFWRFRKLIAKSK